MLSEENTIVIEKDERGFRVRDVIEFDIIEFGDAHQARRVANRVAQIIEPQIVEAPNFTQDFKFGRAKTLRGKIEQTLAHEGRCLPEKETT